MLIHSFITVLLLPVLQQSLLSLIDSKNSGCLNESPSHSLSSIVKGASGGKWLESDADEQLIMTLAVSQKILQGSMSLNVSLRSRSLRHAKHPN